NCLFFLKKVIPSQTRLLLSAISDESFSNNNVHSWTDVYDLKMTNIKRNALQEAIIDFVSPDSIISTTFTIKDLYLPTIQMNELDFESTFTLEITRNGILN